MRTHFRFGLIALSALSLLAIAGPEPAHAQWTPGTCYCVTRTHTEGVYFLGIQIGTREITTTECFY